jgi:multimeric flavodoxin WrbA
MQTAIVLGTARRQGNTAQLSSHVSRYLANVTPSAPPALFDLAEYDIGGYDYAHHNRHDDFLPLIRKIMACERIVLATPMYWYAASGIMKTFLDRLSDLVTIEKDLGRQLRGRRAALIATGGDLEPPACFEDVFRLIWQYLGVQHEGMLYCHCPGTYDAGTHETAVAGFVRRLHAQ